MYLKDLAIHIVDLQTWLGNALKGDSYDFIKDHKPLEFTTFKNLAIYLEVKENLEFVKYSQPDFWMQSFTITARDHIIMKAPKIAVLRSLITNHLTSITEGN